MLIVWRMYQKLMSFIHVVLVFKYDLSVFSGSFFIYDRFSECARHTPKGVRFQIMSLGVRKFEDLSIDVIYNHKFRRTKMGS